ncbi:SAM-dependent methyltransferase [Actinosynnema sp. NPDC020468]|uniref:SAM-dependent methyltransferase n=1 Tax=Actinosynnema sp. NPDC020468 TaxID=3154488 RepID=UPI0033D13604
MNSGRSFAGSAVESTAFVIALARAVESRRPDALFTDDLADAFVGAAGGPDAVPYAALRKDGAPHHDFFAVRTRYFDDFVVRARADGCRQVVILAAGLDTRAFRLGLPRDTTVFELDLPDVLAFKQRVIDSAGARPTADRVVVPSDLTGDWLADLVGAGLRVDEPIAWVAEGILFFLPPPVQEAVLAGVGSASSVGSRLAVEQVNTAFLDGRPSDLDLGEFARNGAAWLSAVDDPAAWLAARGWAARVVEPTEVARSLGRDVPRPTRGAGAGRVWFASAHR